MTISLIDAESLLAVDLGSMHTRVSLFDVVDGRFHFIATGSAPTTVNAPHQDAGAGFTLALQNLEGICGRKLVNSDRHLILPSQPDGSGIDRLVFTHSAGPRMRMVLAGLLKDVSLESAERLAATLPGDVVEVIDLNDSRSRSTQIDAILAAKPNFVIVSGGTETGASRSVYDLVELVALVCQILPAAARPSVLYAGNRVLAKNIKEFLEKMTRVRVAPNLRPAIDQENLGPAQALLGKVFTDIRLDQIGGLQEITKICSIHPAPSSHAFGRMVRFLSQLYDPKRGVMGIDLGSSALTIASAVSGKTSLQVFPFGVGSALQKVIEASQLDEITQWLAIEIPEENVRDYLWQKSLYPHTIPATTESLAIEQAVARQALRLALRQLKSGIPDLLMNFEPFLISGSTLTRTPNPMNSLLMLLDGIQPVGVTTFVLDQNNLVAGLGAASEVNSILPVQVLESGAFLNLGTVISPISNARFGSSILRVRLEFDGGNISHFEVKKGTIVALPLQPGQSARIHLEGLRRTNIDPVSGARTGSYRIIGGACGAVIDARGRPLVLPGDPAKRRDLLRKWNHSLGL